MPDGTTSGPGPDGPRRRLRELGIAPGVLPPGERNDITDVSGVLVGQVTLFEGDSVRTGVTVVLPHAGNLFRHRVPAGLCVGNGYGKLIGATQLKELGELETPIVLTNTLAAPRAADALIGWTLERPGNERVTSVNPVVGETNDGVLNDIRARVVGNEHVLEALARASDGPVEQGVVGAGTGTVAFGFKGGIGSASRKLPERLGGATVGVLVQTNFGGVLQVAGARVGERAGRYFLREELERAAGTGGSSERGGAGGASSTGLSTGCPAVSDLSTGSGSAVDSIERAADGRAEGRADESSDDGSHGGSDAGSNDRADGSIMIVIATEAPLSDRNLERLAARALIGLGRTGAAMSNGSGDYALAFSTAESVRRSGPAGVLRPGREYGNEALSPLFLAAIEATEEAIYDSLCLATTVVGHEGRVAEALPLELILPE